MRVETIVGASELCVTPEEVRAYLRFGSDIEDARITRFIQAATESIEAYTGLTFVETTYRAWTDRISENLRIPRLPVISIISAFDTDLDVVEYERFQDVICFPVATTILFKAGYLRPAAVLSNVVTLSSHGYTNGDTVTINEGQFTVANATTDTFEVTGVADGNVLVGVLPNRLRECLVEEAADRYLRGSAEQQLSKEIKYRLNKLRVDVGFV